MQPTAQNTKKTQVKRVKRRIDGVLLLDKPLGFSSNQALQKVKWLYQAEKAGHTGTLDPLATGMLPICLGEATKFAQYLTDADKTYIATIQFGVTTTTGDAEGAVLMQQPVHFNESELLNVLQQFQGNITQVPPMYSALKHEGKALYEYARAGVEVVRKARDVIIKSIQLNQLDQNVASITVTCSKGTYIRTLAEDIGQALGCGAHLIGLRRTTTAGFDISKVVTIEMLESMAIGERDQLLMPVDTAIEQLPKVILNADAAYYVLQGQAVWQSGKIPNSELRLYDEQQHFLGLGYLQSDGKIAPKRLLQSKVLGANQ